MYILNMPCFPIFVLSSIASLEQWVFRLTGEDKSISCKEVVHDEPCGTPLQYVLFVLHFVLHLQLCK